MAQIYSTVDDIYKSLENGIKINDKVSFIHPKTGGKNKNMSLGRVWFNLILPDDHPLVDDTINQSKLNKIIISFTDKYEPSDLAIYVNRIQREAFKLSTYIPASFSISSMILPKNVKKNKDDFHKIADTLDPIDYNVKAEEITSEYTKELENNNERIYNILSSGAKGDSKMFSSLMVSQGYITDIEGNLVGPIKKGIADGYNVEEFYQAASEARRGFYYSATRSIVKSYCIN